MRLAVKSADNFVTYPLQVIANAQGLSYTIGEKALDFAAMQQLRRPIRLPNAHTFTCELANLGVSTHLSIHLAGELFEILVQSANDARTLKLISGYVPAEHLNEPWPVMLQEITEECLIQTRHGWLGGRYAGEDLAKAYSQALPYADNTRFSLKLTHWKALPTQHGICQLYGAPKAYIHTPTASLQLIYRLHLTLPENASLLRLEHVDETFRQGHLIVERNATPNLYLRPLTGPPNRLYQWFDGQLIPMSTEGLFLSEAFAPQRGWLIETTRIGWPLATTFG